MAKWKIAWERSLCHLVWPGKVWRVERWEENKMDRKRGTRLTSIE